ncbi:TetR/AcrR family transcriptional regulator [Plantactinospora sp. CA-290183]|uniref:TetR/AcrR family transcriptional regulator n=1 Tax=Plantactinospora sp. CA-290183 TaxID=3240006 RepID=UPI003D8C7D24
MAPSDRPYHHGTLRTALLTEARQILERDGAESVSLRAVARAAGVSPTAPYNHFASRRDLLAAMAGDGFADLASRQQQAAASTSAREARFVALSRSYLDFAATQPQLYRLMFGAGVQHWHDVPAVAAAKSAAILPLRTAIAERLTGPGETASLDIAVVAAWSVAHGLAMLLIDGSLDRRPSPAGMDLATAAMRWFFAQVTGD